MTAYLSIFEGQSYALVMLVVAISCSLVVFRSSLILRTVIMTPGMWLAPIFYCLYIAIWNFASPEIFGALIIELVILFTWLFVVRRLLKTIADQQSAELVQLRGWLKVGVFTQIIIGVVLFGQGGVGIFSEGSRIEYIADSRINLYLTYISGLISGMLVPIAASVVSVRRKWDGWVLLYIILNLLLSVISGSKGAGLIQLIVLVCFINISDRNTYFDLVKTPMILGSIFIFATVFVVGDFLNIEPWEMINLMFSRVFLVNDGRALAIDFASSLNRHSISLFQESFRGLATLTGHTPTNVALGQLLYTLAFSTEGLTGANTSCTALLIAYGSEVEKVVYIIFIILIAFFLVWFACLGGKYSILRLALVSILLNLLSQDFLAFQVTFNIVCAIFPFCYLAVNARRLLRSSVVSKRLKIQISE